MPTFFEGLKRMISGKPVFQPGEGVDGVTHKSEEVAAAQHPVNEPQVAPAVESPGSTGPKIIPEVIIQRVEYRNNGSNMDVSVDIKNLSQRVVMVDKIMILGSPRQIGYVLNPGEMREMPVFSGPRPTHRNYTDCELQYRDQETGDYFSAQHLVEYDAQEADGTYTIRNIRFIPPIKDI